MKTRRALLSFLLAAPVFFVLVVAILACVSYVKQEEQSVVKWRSRKLYIVAIVVVFLFQPQSVQSALTLFSCKTAASSSSLQV